MISNITESSLQPAKQKIGRNMDDDLLGDYDFDSFPGRKDVTRLNGTANGNGDPPIRDLGSSKRHWAARTLHFSGCGYALRRLPTWRGVLVLNYHRIGYPNWSDLDRNLWSATPEAFHAQMEFLKQHYDVVGLADLDQALTNRRGRAVMITFDDGYLDNYTRAFKVLSHFELPATFFVTTGFLDHHLVPWWDEIAWMVRNTSVESLPKNPWTVSAVPVDLAHWESAITQLLKTYKQLNEDNTRLFLEFLGLALQTGRCPMDVGKDLWMTWDMVRDMRLHGMTIGGHSVTHPILASLSPERQDFEVGESRRRLVEELGEPIDAFSYPVGGGASYNHITAESLRRHGYRWGFTYLGGYLKPGRFDSYALRRTAIEMETDLPLFHSLLSLPQIFA